MDSWDLNGSSTYILKSNHANVVCRLKDEEEIQVLDNEKIVLDRESLNYDPEKHHLYHCTVIKNRLFELKAIEKAHQENSDVIVAECFTPERIKTSNWVYYSDLSVLGEKYSEMVYIDTLKILLNKK